MSEERYLLRGELEETKDKLVILYDSLKQTTAYIYQKVYEITDSKTTVYQDEINQLKTAIDKVAVLKQEIKALEERAEYLRRKLKEV